MIGITVTFIFYDFLTLVMSRCLVFRVPLFLCMWSVWNSELHIFNEISISDRDWLIRLYFKNPVAQSTVTVEYTDYISAEG